MSMRNVPTSTHSTGLLALLACGYWVVATPLCYASRWSGPDGVQMLWLIVFVFAAAGAFVLALALGETLLRRRLSALFRPSVLIGISASLSPVLTDVAIARLEQRVAQAQVLAVYDALERHAAGGPWPSTVEAVVPAELDELPECWSPFRCGTSFDVSHGIVCMHHDRGWYTCEVRRR